MLKDGKMLIFGRTFGSGAATWLRCEQHLNALARAGFAHCIVHDPKEDDSDLAWKAMVQSDVFVSQAARPPDFIFETVQKWTDKGMPWVWDVDDDPLNISPFNPAYVAFGTAEVRLAEPVNGESWLWRDGMTASGMKFDVNENIKRHNAFINMLQKHVTAVTTTTEYLAAKLRKITDKPVYLRPNVLDFEEIWTDKRKPALDGKIRILYQGGSSHTQDLAVVLPALRAISKAYPHVIFVFMGDTKAHAAKFIPEERIETFEWAGDYKMFAQRQALLGPDIAIAPLCMDDDHAEFNRCKSALKWLDAAAIGVPCVCQWDTPYKEVVTFGRPDVEDQHWNGLLASDEADWFHCLASLIESKDMRETIGANAHAEAKSDWNVDVWLPEYMQQYREIVDGNARHADPQGVAGEAR